MRSCCSTITMGRAAMGGQQEMRWGGLYERACARDRPGLFYEPQRLQVHGRRALLHHVWVSTSDLGTFAAERVSLASI